MVTEAEARRQRPMMSGIIALTVATVVAIGWYYAGRPDESARPMDTLSVAELDNLVRAGRADGKLLTFAPEVPEGWEIRSARYLTGVSPHWHVGLLTGNGRYVGLEEARDATPDMIAQYVDEDASRGEDVDIDGVTWQVWTDQGGDYALIRTVENPAGEQERVLVVGTAPEAEIRDLAASLTN